MAGRRRVFGEEDLKVLSQYSPTSNEFNVRLQEILDTPRETKTNVSKKSLSRLRDVIGQLRGGKKVKTKPCRKPTVDRCALIQDIITLQLNSASEGDIKRFVKQKFKERCGGKSPHRNTIFNILEQCKPDVEAGYSLLLLRSDDWKDVEKANGLERIQASPVVFNEGLEPTAVERLSKKVKGPSKKRKLSSGKQSSEFESTAVERLSKKVKAKNGLNGNENMSTKTQSSGKANAGLERVPAGPVVLNEEFESTAVETVAKEIAAVGKDDGKIQSFDVALNDDIARIPKRSYREAIRIARLLLSPGDQPEPVGRESKVAAISDALINSLQAIDCGKVEEMGSSARAKVEGVNRFVDENVGDDGGILNIYVCGSPGLGKTLCIEKVLRTLEARQEAETISVCSSNSIPVFKVIRLQGTTVQTSNELYSVLASRLHLQSGDPRSAVLSLFRSPAGIATCRRKSPTTILFIDEIDRAPITAIREVLEIAGTATRQSEEEEEGWVKAGPYNCNVIVIGAANNRLFCENVGISCGAQRRIYRCCFEPYDSQPLFNILKRRTEGLFDYSALKLLSLKVACEGGDVRFLLQLADRCLLETTNKLRRQHENREDYVSSTDITVVPCSGPNPLENWEGECKIFV